jgi:hypothetical protein
MDDQFALLGSNGGMNFPGMRANLELMSLWFVMLDVNNWCTSGTRFAE